MEIDHNSAPVNPSSIPAFVRGSLTRKLILVFGLFVVAGSVLLVLWLNAQEEGRSRQTFALQVKANAEFLHRTRLPATERMAEDLSQVLGKTVVFRTDVGGFLPALPDRYRPLESALSSLPDDGQVHAMQRTEAVRRGNFFVLRPAQSPINSLIRGSTLAALGIFWGLSLALAAAVSRTIVRPLRSLSRALPQIGAVEPLELPGSTRRDEIGHVARVFLETQRQLQTERQRRAAAERLALLGKMATGLAHEIQNPVAAIRMHGQLLQRQAPGDASLDMIVRETETIEALVNQWLFLARPEAPLTSPADLAALLRHAAETVRLRAEHAGVEVRLDLGEEPLQVPADRRRLTQVFANLLLNAIQAMPDGGMLTVTLHRESAAAAVEVRDTGKGFSVAALEHWQDLFFSEKEGGMGIGLSVAAEVVKAHGGTLRVRNHHGGVVIVTLPLCS